MIAASSPAIHTSRRYVPGAPLFIRASTDVAALARSAPRREAARGHGHASMLRFSCWTIVSPLVMPILRGLARSAIGMRRRSTPAV